MLGANPLTNMHHQTQKDTPYAQSSSVSAEEIAHFSTLAKDWWDPNGPMRLLHAMNPVRIAWAMRYLPLPEISPPQQPTRRARILDIGCGAGIASESLAQAGYDVLGLDASAEGIAAAQAHLAKTQNPAKTQNLNKPFAHDLITLHYRCGNIEDLVHEKQCFDAIVAFELIEHVTNPEQFMILLAQLVQPGGTLIISTLNRTYRSLIIAKIAAEYLFNLVPTGTHEWRKFIQPAELGHYARKAGFSLTAITGFSALSGTWKESSNLSINYAAAFKKL